MMFTMWFMYAHLTFAGVNFQNPDANISTGVGGPCPVGHYCPEGTGLPLPCPLGTFSNRYYSSHSPYKINLKIGLDKLIKYVSTQSLCNYKLGLHCVSCGEVLRFGWFKKTIWTVPRRFLLPCWVNIINRFDRCIMFDVIKSSCAIVLT